MTTNSNTARFDHRRIERFSDPQDQGSYEREFEYRVKYMGADEWKGPGRLTDFGSLFCKVMGGAWGNYDMVQDWMLTVLPTAARYSSKALGGEGSDCVHGFEESNVGDMFDKCPEIAITRR